MATEVTEKNLSTRNRAVQSEFRKRQLIDATVSCIEKYGLSQTTMANIAKHAGVSQGIVVFHFQTKEALLEQTLRRLNDDYSHCWQNAYDEADPNALGRLCAVVKAIFSPSICNKKLIGVWYAFWGDARSRLLYKSLCDKDDNAYSSCLLKQCQLLEATGSPTLNATAAATSIEGMIWGLWQELLIGSTGFKRQNAIANVFDLLKLIYPDRRKEIDQLEHK